MVLSREEVPDHILVYWPITMRLDFSHQTTAERHEIFRKITELLGRAGINADTSEDGDFDYSVDPSKRFAFWSERLPGNVFVRDQRDAVALSLLGLKVIDSNES